MTTQASYPELFSLAVHEFRTPASVVGGYLRMLQRDTDPPLSDRQRKMVEEADKSCARIVALVAELSDISKLDAGLAPMAAETIDLFAMVAEVAEHVHEAEDRGVRLELRGETAGGQLRGDPNRLRNAFDAVFRAILREKPGPITIVVDRRVVVENDSSSAVFVIADESSVQTAYGAAPGVFDEKRGGLGLALPLARRVIEAHGGRLWAPAITENGREEDRSEADRRGTAIIALPLGTNTGSTR
jgi:signal transduction histidine kinase